MRTIVTKHYRLILGMGASLIERLVVILLTIVIRKMDNHIQFFDWGGIREVYH